MQKIVILLYSLILGSINTPAFSQGELKAYGVQINVTDMDKAIKFYREILDFQIEQNGPNKTAVLLKPRSGKDKIILNKVSYLLPVADNEARASLTLQVNNLDSTIALLKSRGVDFGNYEKRKEGVGYAIYFNDPFDARLSIMQETVVENPLFTEPRIYNYGFYTPDMDSAIKFFTTKLGFSLRSKNYLPLDAPINNSDGSFAFMLHTRNGVEAIHYNDAANEHLVLLFRTDNIEEAIKTLNTKGVKLAASKIKEAALGRSISFYDPFGYISLLIETKE